jgi:hypothetical protein
MHFSVICLEAPSKYTNILNQYKQPPDWEPVGPDNETGVVTRSHADDDARCQMYHPIL